MKILVTGGAGFIGSNFVCSMLKIGHQVITVDKLTYAGNLENFDEYKKHPQHFFYQEDICNDFALQAIFMKHQPDVVVHMAAESHVDRSIDCADDFIQTNIVGTHKVLDAALKYYKTCVSPDQFRFIHLSTDEVFGALGLEGKFNELMPYQPNSPYAASKAASDHLVRAYRQTYGLPTIIVNSSNNYGPKQYPEKLIPLTILNAIEGKPLPVYGNGQQIRDWLYVADHVEALYAIIKNGRVGYSYCVGSDNEMTNLSLVHTICELVDQMHVDTRSFSCKQLITYVADRPGHDFRYATDASQLKEHTGWFPKVSFQDGLKETVRWYADRYNSMVGMSHSSARKRIGLG